VIVVSNTSLIINLAAVGELDLLQRIYGELVIPKPMTVNLSPSVPAVKWILSKKRSTTIERSKSSISAAARAGMRLNWPNAVTTNVLFALTHSIEEFTNANIKEGKSLGNRFDLMTFRDYSSFEVTDDSGNKKTLQCNERFYAPVEIEWYLKSLNFEQIGIFGCELGKFSRELPLTANHPEMLVTARKKQE
jgi:hypothetical protein